MYRSPEGRADETRDPRDDDAPVASWKAFWKRFLPLALVLLLFITLFYRWTVGDLFDRLEMREAVTVESQSTAVTYLLRDVIADALILSEHNELLEFLATGEHARLAELAVEMCSVSRHVGLYDQVRFIDASGQEIVRINNNDGHPTVVPEAQLQDKRDRYYFQDVMELTRGEVYLSALDLNIEHGAVEIPYKPMIRVGVLVFDAHGRKRGTIMINYLAQTLLDSLGGVGRISSGDPMLLNQEGYWLLSPDPAQSWGFMFATGADHRLAIEDPPAWSHMTRNPSGHVYTPEGLYTYRWLDLVADTRQIMTVGFSASEESEALRWSVLTRVPAAFIEQRRAKILLPLVALGLVVLGLMAVGVRIMVTARAQRRHHQEHLERLARLDALTGIANRRTFEERLEREMARTDRHGRPCALLMIDLDGFKAVNDTQGHQVGDQVLKDVAKLLRESLRVRSEDLVARFGGDEFAVLLCELKGVETALAVAEMIRERIGRPVWGGQSVSASIGVALYPDHARDMPDLFRLADRAMYDAKHAGKDRSALAERVSEV